ncbi:hypothetical protein MSPP1_003248 [Malassezia sp. CBS 17886]|nr:hypothetical protein MSPP1_003248 [Malassezia sp. CBS 17886]
MSPPGPTSPGWDSAGGADASAAPPARFLAPGAGPDTPTVSKKRAHRNGDAGAAPLSEDDDLDDDDIVAPWHGDGKGSYKCTRKGDSAVPRGSQGRDASQPRAESTRRDTSADLLRRSESRAPPGDAEPYRKDGDRSDPDDEDAESDGAEGEALAEDEFSRQQAIYAAQQRNMGLLSHLMDEDQLERHMASRRAALNKANVRKLVNHVLSQSVSQHIVMAASGVGKVFVGEMVELARAVQQERNETGPILPVHLYEAYRRYKLGTERPGHYPPAMSSGSAGLGRRRRLF